MKMTRQNSKFCDILVEASSVRSKSKGQGLSCWQCFRSWSVRLSCWLPNSCGEDMMFPVVSVNLMPGSGVAALFCSMVSGLLLAAFCRLCSIAHHFSVSFWGGYLAFVSRVFFSVISDKEQLFMCSRTLKSPFAQTWRTSSFQPRRKYDKNRMQFMKFRHRIWAAPNHALRQGLENTWLQWRQSCNGIPMSDITEVSILWDLPEMPYGPDPN